MAHAQGSPQPPAAHPSFSYTFAGAPGGWEMVSVPYEVDQSFSDFGLLALILDPSRNAYLAASDSTGYPADSFHLGRAYWVYQTYDWTLTGTGWQANPYQPFGVRLQPGWNMVANPFNFPIPLAYITVFHADRSNVPLLNDGTTSFLYVYDGVIGQYSPPNGLQSPNQTLDPWRGAWLYSTTNATLYFYPPSSLQR